MPVGAAGEAAFTLSNAGGGAIELLSVQLSAGDPDRFELDRDGDMVLSGEQVLDVLVTFTPRREEQSLGRVTVRTEDDTLDIDLVGVGGPSQADDDGDGVRVDEGDCDDDDPQTYPGAPELCDGADNDCDGQAEPDEADADRDGVRVCEGDCDDGDAAVYPGAPEICDGKDSDCDGRSADDADLDGDGASVCEGDCDDDDEALSPLLAEVCDGLDNDCSGEVDDIDLDGDGHSVCHPAGDCDDDDARAFPVIVDPSASGAEQDGTAAAPYADVATALANLDAVCRTAWLAPGAYELSLSFGAGDDLSIEGASADEVTLSPAAGQRVFELADGAEVALRGLTLSGGDAPGDGGAVRVSDSTLLLQDVAFVGNRSAGDGGALAATSSTVEARDCRFEGNVAADDGGAVALLSASYEDEGSTYLDNQGVRGGAVVSDGAALTLRDASLRGNVATDTGGAVAVIGGTRLVLERNLIVLNRAASAGGGVAFTDVSVSGGLVRNNLLQDNDGGALGGGLHVGGNTAAFEISNNTLFANVASGEGACLSVTPPGSLTVANNVLGWCDGASGLYLAQASGHALTHNSAYATRSGADFAGAASAGVDDNLDLDPLFRAWTDNRDPDDDDLRPGQGSHCIDSGRQDSRFNDQDGSRNDRGHTGGPAAP